MIYAIVIFFLAVGIFYPLLGARQDKICKQYFIECLENDLYFPNTDYLLDNDMEDDVRAAMDQMIEIAKKYMKNPEFENEYLRKYNIGFETYKNENLDDLVKYLEERHERKMQDPEYRAAYEQMSQYDKSLVTAEIYKRFTDAKNNKPSVRKFVANIERLKNRKK